jgi:hypothetical protein
MSQLDSAITEIITKPLIRSILGDETAVSSNGDDEFGRNSTPINHLSELKRPQRLHQIDEGKQSMCSEPIHENDDTAELETDSERLKNESASFGWAANAILRLLSLIMNADGGFDPTQ